MYYVYVNDINIAVYDLNPSAKKTVLFIHGWPLGHKIFEYQTNILPKLGYRTASIDLRGFGKSDATSGGYTYSQLADDIYKVVHAIGLKDFTLVGFSMGGAIVLRYMSLFNGYGVSKLVLAAAAAPSFVQRPPEFPYGMTREDVNKLIAQACTDRPEMVTDFGEKVFASNPPESFRRWFNDIGFSASGIGTIGTAVSLRDEELFNDLKCVRVPTGIFHGKLDEICPYEFAVFMNEKIEDSILYTFEYSGHAIFYDELKLFNQKFLQFLEE